MDASIYVIAPLPPTALIFDASAFSLAPFPTFLIRYGGIVVKILNLSYLVFFRGCSNHN